MLTTGLSTPDAGVSDPAVQATAGPLPRVPGLNADYLDDRGAEDFALVDHDHDGAYYRKLQADARFLPIGGKARDADHLDGLDAHNLQLRVEGSCPGGSAIRSISGQGGVVCQQFVDAAGWRLVARDDFTSEALGWSQPGRTTCDEATVLGGFGQLSGTTVSKTFDLTSHPHQEVQIVFTYWFGDSWDGETAFAKAGPLRVWSTSSSYAPEPAPGAENICGARWTDVTTSVRAVASHSSDSLDVTFGSTLDDRAADEWFGIDFLEVWVR